MYRAICMTFRPKCLSLKNQGLRPDLSFIIPYMTGCPWPACTCACMMLKMIYSWWRCSPFSCPSFRWPVSHHPAMYLHIILPLWVKEQNSSGRNRNDSNNMLPRLVIMENHDTESALRGIPSPEGEPQKSKKVMSLSILPAQTPICLTVSLEWAQISVRTY